MAIDIIQATQATPDLVVAINALISQLSHSARPATLESLAGLIASPASTLFVAREDQAAIVGMLTLTICPIPTGARATIEDVVVLDTHRGQGIARQLVESALAFGRAKGAGSIDLTSKPSRMAANQLYRKLGFQPRETNVYRYEL